MFQSLIDWFDRLGPRLHAAFVEGDRWQLYLDGLLTTLELTVVAAWQPIISALFRSSRVWMGESSLTMTDCTPVA